MLQLEKDILNYFCVEEFISKRYYQFWGDDSIHVMNYGLVRLADWLRHRSGAGITINTWKWGGQYQWSGLRTGDSGYSNNSPHMTGNALDIKSDSHTPKELARLISDNWEEVKQYTGLRGLRFEHFTKTPTWLHVDSLQYDGNWRVFMP